jgi:hypothetical protein
VAGEFAALDLAEIAIPDRLEHLCFRPEHHGRRLRDEAVDHNGKCWIFLLFKAARTLEFGFTFYNPGIGRLFAVEGLSFAVDDLAVLFDHDLGGKAFGPVFASPFYD